MKTADTDHADPAIDTLDTLAGVDDGGELADMAGIHAAHEPDPALATEATLAAESDRTRAEPGPQASAFDAAREAILRELARLDERLEMLATPYARRDKLVEERNAKREAFETLRREHELEMTAYFQRIEAAQAEAGKLVDLGLTTTTDRNSVHRLAEDLTMGRVQPADVAATLKYLTGRN